MRRLLLVSVVLVGVVMVGLDRAESPVIGAVAASTEPAPDTPPPRVAHAVRAVHDYVTGPRDRDPVKDVLRPVPAPVQERLTPVEAMHADFLRMDLSPDLADLEPEEQDAALVEALTEKAATLAALEVAYQAVLEGAPSPELRRATLERLGDCYEHMGVALSQSTPPTRLNPKQVEVYRNAMAAKAEVQFLKADEAWELAGR